MSYNIEYTSNFSRELKKLAKKFKSIKADFSTLLDELEENPTLGTSIGNDCYKIRLAIKSKGKGKSGGARVITHITIKENTIYLLSIYDKGDKDSLSDKEILELIKAI